MSASIGIDLGTDSCRVAVWRNDRFEMIPNERGNYLTPSWVRFCSDGQPPVIGESAKNQAASYPLSTVFDAQRLLGRSIDDPKIQKMCMQMPLEVFDKKGVVAFVANGQSHGVDEVISTILAALKKDAEAYLNTTLKLVVISVPAHFTMKQRAIVWDSAVKAGLPIRRLVSGPSYVALGHHIDHPLANPGVLQNVLVISFGAGNLGFSTIGVEDGIFEVLKTWGSGDLGGKDFDAVLMEHFLNEFKVKYNKEVTPRALFRLNSQCERAKRDLSSCVQTSIDLEHFVDEMTFHSTITRDQFERLSTKLFDKFDQMLRQAASGADRIDKILLVGGSTRIPRIQELVTKWFPSKPILRASEDSTAFGAAVQAAIMSDTADDRLSLILVLDAIPYDISVSSSSLGPTVVIPRNTDFPLRKVFPLTISASKEPTKVRVLEGNETVKVLHVIASVDRAVDAEVIIHIDSGMELTATVRVLSSRPVDLERGLTGKENKPPSTWLMVVVFMISVLLVAFCILRVIGFHPFF